MKTNKKNKQIRKRTSYCFWRNIVREVRTWSGADSFGGNMICDQMWRYMDDRFMFGTRKQSQWDKESMKLAVEDYFAKIA